MLHDTPEQPRGSGRQLRHFAQLGRLAVRAEWRRGVGRQARQSGGGISLLHKRFLNPCILKRVQVRCTCLVPPLHASRTVGRLRCSTARRRISAEADLPGRLDGGRAHGRGGQIARSTTSLEQGLVPCCRARRRAGRVYIPEPH